MTAAEAMEQSEADMKKRRRATNADLLAKYLKRKEQTQRKLERAILKTLRAANYLSRIRKEELYIRWNIVEVSAAIDRGETFPKAKAKKKKTGRHIELE